MTHQTLRQASSLSFLLLLSLTLAGFGQQSTKLSSPAGSVLPLKNGWFLQSSRKVDDPGSVISRPTFQPKGWYPVSVPTTVLAGLVKNKVYPDPYYGMNLRSIPGTTYPIGANFVNIPMAQDSPFMVPWWFRKEFVVPAENKGKTLWLKLNGINYRANVWLNGIQIAKSGDLAGTWRTWEFNVTSIAVAGKPNVLAVEVFSPLENDLALTFVDWNPMPPDKDMGLFRGVELVTSGPVAVRFPAVMSKVDSTANDAAHLTVTAVLKNGTNRPQNGTLKARIEDIEIAQNVALAPNETKNIVFTPEQFSALNLKQPRLWWPRQMGSPTLHALHLEFIANGTLSDQSDTKFGIREISSELIDGKWRAFSVNGRRLLIRGGGWAPDMMLRHDPSRMQDEFRYVEDMGLNTIRLEDHLEPDDFFDLADRDGILVMAGWTCCSPWEHWANWKPQDFTIAEQSLRAQLYRLRSHPSVLAWFNGSDNAPPPDVEQTYLNVEKELLWPNPAVSSATASPTSLTGESGVKMTGPYDYVPPSYWLEDTPDAQPRHDCNPGGCGGAYGFNTETSMGAAVPPIESIRTMVPKEHLWPIDEWWNFHAGGESFQQLNLFTNALNVRYGTATNVEDFAFKSQLMAYEGVRAMYEAYSRNKYTATGVIQWMLNNAWPSTIWHLYDYSLRPGGGYFGAKLALQALHPVYGYDDHSVWLVNSQYEDASNLRVTIRVLNLDATEKFSQQLNVNAAADSTQKLLALPQVDGLSSTYFLLLRVENEAGKLVGSNFYWLSTKPETLDWAKSNWYTTPIISYADFTAFSQLPKVSLKVSERTERRGEDSVTHVTIENPSKNVAFFVRLKLDKGAHGEEILPILWEDNYISLLPGEKREVTATCRSSLLGSFQPSVEVEGLNADGK